jgi:RHS repeat-associated protein
VGGSNALDRIFEYDPIYRLTKATGRENPPTTTPIWDDRYRSNDDSTTTAYTRNYSYDEIGNIQQLQHIGNNNFTRNFNYISGSNHLQSIDIGQTTHNFTYDAAGNQTQEGASRFFEWDHNDRLRCFYVDDGSTITKYTHYLYDSGGNRVKKLTRKQNGDYDSTTYIDGLHEYRTDGSSERTTAHLMPALPASGDDEARIAMVRQGHDFGDTTPATKYILSDHLGSSSVELEDSGAFIDKEEYYPFGETSFGAYQKKRYKYNGKERDEESGLYYYGARYYSAWTCRFTSVDPKAPERPRHSPYSYTDNNPVNLVDPKGENPIVAAIAQIISTIASVASAIQGIISAVTSAISSVASAITNIVNAIGNAINKAVQAVSDAISSAIDTVGSTIESAVDSIGGKGQSGGNISGEKSKFEAAQSQPKSPSAGDGGMSGSSGGQTSQPSTPGSESKMLDTVNVTAEAPPEMTFNETIQLAAPALNTGLVNPNAAEEVSVPQENASDVSDKGLEFISKFESFESEVYVDPGGYKTIGYGHKVLPSEDFSGGISQEKAWELLKKDVRTKATKYINKYVEVSLNQHQFDALASYVYNVGVANSLIDTQLIKYLNQGKFKKAATEMDINTSKGKFLQGLQNRRIVEQKLFLNGKY